jgi:hypothetical protein
MWYRAYSMLVSMLVAVVAAACAIIDTVDPRYDVVNRASAKARNEGILLNIVRASRNVPLNFIAFSRVSGSQGASATVALPTFLLGPTFTAVTTAVNAAGAVTGQTFSRQLGSPQRDVIFNDRTAGASANALNSFEISLLETKEFYSGLLHPVDLPTLNFFIRQGYERELLFWLFTESVRVSTREGVVEFRNDPDSAVACEPGGARERCFSNIIDLALATGLTVETRSEKSASGGRPVVYGRLCFDRVLMQRARREYPPEMFTELQTVVAGQHRPRCGIVPWINADGAAGKKKGGTPASAATDTLRFEVLGSTQGPLRFEITTRSVYGIYQFLGRIVRTDNPIRLRGRGDDELLLTIVRRDVLTSCFVALDFEGIAYCVPNEGAENTKRVFGLLTQLLALRTLVGDLAITPTVRVAP